MEEPGWLKGALRWRFIERFGRVQELQRKRLGTAAELAQWAPALDESPPVVGCVLANEVLDNFPFHRLQLDRHGEVREVYVDLEGECLVERLGPLSAGELVDTARQAAPRLQEGDRFEVCLELEGWCRQASQALERGYLLIVDYGDVEPDIWLQGRAGSLKTYGPGGMGQDPLREPGRQDITADVNLSALARAVEAAGFQPQPLTTQRAWLLSLGLGRVAEELDLAGFAAALEGWQEQAVVIQGELNLVLKLVAEGGLGDLLVFRAGKAAPPLPAGGARGG